MRRPKKEEISFPKRLEKEASSAIRGGCSRWHQFREGPLRGCQCEEGHRRPWGRWGEGQRTGQGDETSLIMSLNEEEQEVPRRGPTCGAEDLPTSWWQTPSCLFPAYLIPHRPNPTGGLLGPPHFQRWGLSVWTTSEPQWRKYTSGISPPLLITLVF